MGNQRAIDVTESPEIHETRYQGIGKAGIIMIKINGKPILLHIMKHYAKYGYKDFYIALGYRGEVIKLSLIHI